MPPSDFACVNVGEFVRQLTTNEAILLTAGVGFWYTHEIPRPQLGMPAIKVSDGPNGIRGKHFFMSTPTKCLPSATALGATWDTDLIEQATSKILASEAKLKAASVILAPICNIPRNPLGGRSFECFSEDPVLSGHITAAYVNGVQSNGIGTTVKHFVCNEKEDDHMGYSSTLSDRALREIYLLPFMIAQKHAEPWCFMTAYNRVNGTHASENRSLLQDILRDEWKFKGLIMSDWFGTYSIDLSINAGLDLEMPGTNKWRSLDSTNRLIVSRKLIVPSIKERARKIVELVKKAAQKSPEILDGDGIERTEDSEEDKLFLRKLAAESIVLLKNNNGLLPLEPQSLQKIAVVGGNAKAVVLSGGGSASLKPSYFISPYQGIVNALPDVEVTYSEGASIYVEMPVLDFDLMTESGEQGWMSTWYAHESDESMTPLDTPFEPPRLVDETSIYISTSTPLGITRRWTMKLEGRLKPRARNYAFQFGLSVNGRARLCVDGKLAIDAWTRQRRGRPSFYDRSLEERATINLKAGVEYNILVEFCNVRAPADGDESEEVQDFSAGVRLGGAEVQDPDAMMAEAVKLASEADVVIAVVGLNAELETEGNDRETLALPGRTDELITKVLAANSKTVVVTQSGSSITMPWADSVPAIVHSWYLGSATGDAIADVLFGKKNPSGKLSLTFPKRLEDIPSYGHFHSDNGELRYGEGLFVGYKHFQYRDIAPQFAFGHGLSYTTFALSDLDLSAPVIAKGEFCLTATVTVTNTGPVVGSEVVQLYISMPTTSELKHPLRRLHAFGKARDLAPGKSTCVVLQLDKIAVSYWDHRVGRWVIEQGEYTVSVGPSSDILPLTGSFVVDETMQWRGL